MNRRSFKIVLASASPRRKSILESLNIDFDIIPANIKENINAYLSPEKMVVDLALQKALAVEKKLFSMNYPIEDNLLILAADTLVFYNGKALGKPNTAEEAYSMLSMLSGQIHEVYTGITLVKPSKGSEMLCSSLDRVAENSTTNTNQRFTYAKSLVYFRSLTPSTINSYIKTGEPMDKAGAYGIQEYGALLVEKINGCYFNVVGLPVVKLSELLNDFNYEIL